MKRMPDAAHLVMAYRGRILVRKSRHQLVLIDKLLGMRMDLVCYAAKDAAGSHLHRKVSGRWKAEGG